MHYPALDVHHADPDLALALAQDCFPSAAQEHDGGITIFFTAAHRRDQAQEAIRREMPDAQLHAREVDDEDWARRSQENLGPVTVGRVRIIPPWHSPVLSAAPASPAVSARLRSPVVRPRARARPRQSAVDPPARRRAVTIVIEPSMGFGTGHHASTRLCLKVLQQIDISGRSLLDVGTGSGVLALAARRLGAAEALGIDNDPDAIRSATENLRLNPAVTKVRFELADAGENALPQAYLVAANLSGALLARVAPVLARSVRPAGTLIAGGMLVEEAPLVADAFKGLHVKEIAREDGWACLVLGRPVR